MCNIDNIIRWLHADTFRMEALQAVSRLNLPDWLIAAGFIRNLIWDKQHGTSTSLNDIDIIYFDNNNIAAANDFVYEATLNKMILGLHWSVKNQARMHLQNGDQPYRSTLDAMHYWPEIQTAIGAKLDKNGNAKVLHSFALENYFNSSISYNPVREIKIFNDRINSKGWLTTWKNLRVKT